MVITYRILPFNRDYCRRMVSGDSQHGTPPTMVSVSNLGRQFVGLNDLLRYERALTVPEVELVLRSAGLLVI